MIKLQMDGIKLAVRLACVCVFACRGEKQIEEKISTTDIIELLH